MKISPINVSVHTTNPELRCRMMSNRFAGDALKILDRFAEAGIAMNAQLVLCPGLNDGAELERSLGDLSRLAPALKTVSCVPVGLTKYRDGLYPLAPYKMCIRDRFNSSPRADGSEKWVDFVSTFWHCQCVSTLPLKSFSARYLKWCRKHGYYFSQEKAFEIHSKAQSCIGVMPRNETTKLLVQQAIAQLKATSAALAALKQEMQSLAASLPEYPVVMEMFGVGSTLGPQLMAEIGDVRRFHSKKALVAFAGIDAPPCQ